MLEIRETTVQFDSKVSKTSEIASELNDIKTILYCIALNLDEPSRMQLVKELSDVKTDSVQQWIANVQQSIKR